MKVTVWAGLLLFAVVLASLSVGMKVTQDQMRNLNDTLNSLTKTIESERVITVEIPSDLQETISDTLKQNADILAQNAEIMKRLGLR